MKRIMIRMGALGTVVVLGLIAIAQAQRGQTIDADPAPTVRAADESPDSGDRRPVPGAQEASAENPLREEVPAADNDPSGKGAILSAPRSSSRPASAAPPAELPDNGGGDPFTRSPGGLPVTDKGTFSDEDSTSLATYEEQSSKGSAGAQLADASGQSLRPYPSNEGDRYPSLRPPEEDAAPSKAPGPQLNTPSPSDPPDTTPADEADRRPQRDQTPPSEPRSRDTSAGEINSDRGTARIPGRHEPDALLGEGVGQPGGKHLEGIQTPQVTIEKVAPSAMQVGKPATFTVKVRNTGPIAATGLEVRDQVPRGAQLTSTTPRASRGTRGELVWSLGTLDPGEETAVEMQVTPTEEGEIGSVATVHFSAAASARSIATKPELAVKSSAPQQVLIGETLKLEITLSNSGSGTATGVVLSERVPPGLRHPAGADLEYDVGPLAPGESRKLELDLVADRPGPVTNVIVARGEGSLRAEHHLDIEVVAPELQLAVDGPQRRFLEREAVYELGVSNPGTAPARNVELVAHLPEGLDFISANNAGHFDEAARAVYWRLEELPVRETGVVRLVTMPVRPGEHSLRIRSTAARGVEAESEQPVLIEGIAAILFEVRDVVDPIEVGGETVYEISVLNQGSKAATNVRVHVLLPPEMEPVAAEGPTQHLIEGRQVAFEALSRLAPKADTMYRLRVRGLEPGDLRVRVQLLTDEMRDVPVTKEESTRVYSDR